MKVCVINNLYPPFARGGAEQVVERTVAGLVVAGHEVVVIASSPQKPWIEQRGTVKIYWVRPRTIFFYTEAHQHSGLSRLVWHLIDIFNFEAAQQIRKIIEDEGPDVVHTHNLMGLSFLLPRVIRKLKIRHIHTVHDVQLVEPSGMILKKYEHTWRYRGLPTRLYTALLRYLVGSPAVVISPSQFLREFYVTRGFFKQSQVEILRNPLTFALAPEHPVDSKGPIKFLYVGQIENHKGVLELVQAFKQMAKTLPAELHIVGGGSQLRAVEKAAQSDTRITVYGRRERVELPKIFSTMDLTVVPSLCYENSPTVIFESFASRVPVLASNIEGIAELIQEGENGVTFAAGNIQTLTEKLQWCVEHRDQIIKMRNNTQSSLTDLSLTEYMSRLERLYQISV